MADSSFVMMLIGPSHKAKVFIWLQNPQFSYQNCQFNYINID